MNFFTAQELRCHCGCGGYKFDEDFLAKLNGIRNLAGVPMILSSAYRCEAHDAAIGGKGVHTQGLAVDVVCTGFVARRILDAAVKYEVKGIGVRQTGPYEQRILHLDDTTGPTRPWIWSY